ncbi:hypothetical protein [Rhodothermus marinus]|uniref:hypothetical protein n=1 Tax=Rhodothermus marinus TaxID=29549 RepID=UPI0012BA4734|nr:hypothetical protein [Rhodothermus marinus]BBM69839.1 hypothetical protein RmaAA213_16850 [Rhodothermus marinus]BBM72825.1 hypothetical protein RmaAA338_16900 [Rhodothermus marinus]
MRRLLFFVLLLQPMGLHAQFIDTFDHSDLDGWIYFTGDGNAHMEFRPGPGYATIYVDARQDRRNIWWALIKRDVTSGLDLALLQHPDYELRIEARIRVSHAPRRVNLHLNTQRTTDFHTHLMEFDIPDTTNWHTISMTTRGFDAVPGDTVYGQLALMDWGLGVYRVDIDYFKVSVVHVPTAGPDQGEAVSYHPPIPPVSAFAHHVSVAHDATIDLAYPELNFNGWYAVTDTMRVPVLAVGASQYAILRWDLRAFAGRRVADHGLLELTTWSVERQDTDLEEFGKLRIVEILGGDPNWDQQTVTFQTLCQGQPLEEVFNTQMIIDVDVTERRGGKVFATISRPVLQRLIDGRTLGIMLLPLGALHATFLAGEAFDGRHAATLHFTTTDR